MLCSCITTHILAAECKKRALWAIVSIPASYMACCIHNATAACLIGLIFSATNKLCSFSSSHVCYVRSMKHAGVFSGQSRFGLLRVFLLFSINLLQVPQPPTITFGGLARGIRVGDGLSNVFHNVKEMFFTSPYSRKC